jgi:hypothetical protein
MLERNEVESHLVDKLDDKRLAEIFLPAIKAILKSGGGAEAILKQSEAMAAVRLSTSAMNASPETALKAAIEILNRTQGRPVERRLNVYADMAEMTEEQLDREIYTLAKRAGVKEQVIDLLQETKPTVSIKTKRQRASMSTHLEKKPDEPK